MTYNGNGVGMGFFLDGRNGPSHWKEAFAGVKGEPLAPYPKTIESGT